MSSSPHNDRTQGLEHKDPTQGLKHKGSTQGLEHTLTTEKMYWLNFTGHNKKFCLTLLYNKANSYLFVNGTKINKFKAKDSEIVATPLGLWNNSKDFSVDSMKKTGLNGCLWFCVIYDAIAVAEILFIYKYLMKRNGMV